MDTHVKVVGWLWIALGALGLIGACCGGGAIVGGGLISGDETAILATGITGGVLGGLLLLSGVLDLVAGIWLLKYKQWARILTLILAVLNLFAFPIGTILGVYSLWVLLNSETEALFSN
jgi:hypothetical protein